MGSSSEEDGSRQREYRRAHKRRLKAKINAIKLELGCEICGYNEHVAALDFDHLDPSKKEFNIGVAAQESKGWGRIQAEIEKCRVLCANCHRIHTYENHVTRMGTT